jgi:hypothetical protein
MDLHCVLFWDTNSSFKRYLYWLCASKTCRQVILDWQKSLKRYRNCKFDAHLLYLAALCPSWKWTTEKTYCTSKLFSAHLKTDYLQQRYKMHYSLSVGCLFFRSKQESYKVCSILEYTDLKISRMLVSIIAVDHTNIQPNVSPIFS